MAQIPGAVGMNVLPLYRVTTHPVPGAQVDLVTPSAAPSPDLATRASLIGLGVGM